MIFITSDHHFGHENIIKHCKRPFRNTDEMDTAMVDRWNEVVEPTDDVYIAGDFSHKRCPADRANDIARSLRGRKHLLLGNHETDNERGILLDSRSPIEDRLILDPSLFASLNEGYFYFRINGRLIVVTHYAMQTWHDMRKKGTPTYHLHGHSHSKLSPMLRRHDIGVDGHNFYPWSMDQIFDHFDPQGKRKGGKAHVGKIETAF
jgi:calcineurin-like phosphoesterase family protein